MKKYLIFLVLLLCSTLSFGAETLTINLQKGQEYTQKISLKSTVFSSSQGQDIKTVTLSTIGVKYKVLNIINENYEIQVKYDYLTSAFEFLDQKYEFSSQGDKSDLTNLLLSNLTKNSFIIVMNKQGTIVSSKNTENLFKNLFDNAPDLLAEDQELLKKQLDESFGGENFKKNLETTSLTYPNKEINVGDSWDIQSETAGPIALIAKNTFTLNKVNADSFELKGVSQIKTSTDKTTSIDDLKIRYNIEGTGSSNLSIDKKTGLIKKCDITQNASGEMIMGENFSVPIKFTNEITME